MHQEKNYSLQERVLATAMYRSLGDMTVRFSVKDDGTRIHSNLLSDNEFLSLVSDYCNDPKECLAWARESLFAISQDSRLSEVGKSERLDRYIDAYISLTLKLDHAAFRPTKNGKSAKGLPEYIPDQFVDLGGDSDTEPRLRFREQILVDKENVLNNYHPLLKEIFAYDYSKLDLLKKKEHIVTWLAMSVYDSVPYGRTQDGGKDLGGGIVPLSNLTEGVCRHQALVFQVLCQAFGIKSQVAKCYIDGGRHSTNVVRINGQWYLLDVTNPDFVVDANGNRIWRPAAFKLAKKPEPKESYNVKQRYNGAEHTYTFHDDMYYYIAEPVNN